MPALTLPSQQRDFTEWHRGRPRFAVWAVALDAHPGLDQRLAQVQAALAPWLLPGYQRQPHITLHICGFPVRQAQAPDDFDLARLQAQASALAEALPAPFTLQLGGAFSFASAACLAVRDEAGHLARLRHALSAAVPEADATPYVPHVTAGLYNGAWPLAQVHERLAPLAQAPELAVTVRALSWMCYDSAVVGGPLRPLLQVACGPGPAAVEHSATLAAVFQPPSPGAAG